MSLLALNAQEKSYLRELHKMEREHENFSHRKMCTRFGWRSVARSFQVMSSLIEKGRIEPAGRRLAYVEVPVVSTLGKSDLKRAA